MLISNNNCIDSTIAWPITLIQSEPVDGEGLLEIEVLKDRLLVWVDYTLSVRNIINREEIWQRSSTKYIGMFREVDEQCIFGYFQGTLCCIDINSGDGIWKLGAARKEYTLGGDKTRIVSIDKSNKPNALICRLKKTGEKIWQNDSLKGIISVIEVHGNKIIILNGFGLQIVDFENGTVLLEQEMFGLIQKTVGKTHFKEGGLAILGPIIGDDVLFGAEDGIVVSFSMKNTKVNWWYKIEDELGCPQTIIYYKNKLYMNIRQGYSHVNYLTCLNFQDGKLLFRTDENITPAGCSYPSIIGKYFVGGYGRYLSFFDLEQEEFVYLYKHKKNESVFGGKVGVYDNILIAHNNYPNTLYWFNGHK